MKLKTRRTFLQTGLWAGAGAVLAGTVRADDWAGWLGPQRDGVWRERGILERFPAGGPPVVWRAPLGGGYSAPAVADGRVVVTDRLTGPSPGGAAAGPLDRAKVPGRERVLCLRERTGEVLWRHEYDCPYDLAYPSGPRAMPQIDGARVFAVGADGHLWCLDLRSGRVLWRKHFPTDYGAPRQTWGVASSPLVAGERLFCQVGGAGQSVVAFDKRSGRELWRALDAKEPGYSSPVLVRAAGVAQLIVWDAEAISGVNPATGARLWSEPFPTRMGHAIATPRVAGDLLYLTSFFDGSLLLRLDAERPGVTRVWRMKGRSETQPEGLHGLMCTPFIVDGHIYGVCGHGELRCLRADTGAPVWETLAATTPDGKRARWATGFLVRHAERFFIWNEMGQLILARLTPAGYDELGRAALLEPTTRAGSRNVVWSMPACANGHIFLRNDRELIRVDLRRRSA